MGRRAVAAAGPEMRPRRGTMGVRRPPRAAMIHQLDRGHRAGGDGRRTGGRGGGGRERRRQERRGGDCVFQHEVVPPLLSNDQYTADGGCPCGDGARIQSKRATGPRPPGLLRPAPLRAALGARADPARSGAAEARPSGTASAKGFDRQTGVPTAPAPGTSWAEPADDRRREAEVRDPRRRRRPGQGFSPPPPPLQKLGRLRRRDADPL